MRHTRLSLSISALSLACAADPADSGVLGAADPGPTYDDPATDLPAPGPYGAGYSTLSMSYDDTVRGEPRAMHLAVWYPSTAPTFGETLRYRDLLVSANAVMDAPLRDGRYPVLVFSHGHQAFAEASGRVMAHFASHGWLVVAADHTDNTFFDGPDRETEIYVQRPLDVSAVLDFVAQAADGPLATADLDTVVAMGHSFGGYTLFGLAGGAYDVENLGPACADGTGPASFCSTYTDDLGARMQAGFSDDRVDAWIPMAPGDANLFSPDGLADLSAPVMVLSGDLDPRVGDNPSQYWATMDRGEHRHVVVEGGGHQTFTDYSEVLESFDGLIGAAEGWDLTHAYTLAFARVHGLGDDSLRPVLDGEVVLSAAAHVLQ